MRRREKMNWFSRVTILSVAAMLPVIFTVPLSASPSVTMEPAVVKIGDKITVTIESDGWILKGGPIVKGPGEGSLTSTGGTLTATGPGYVIVSTYWVHPNGNCGEEEMSATGTTTVIEIRLSLITYRLPISFTVSNQIQPKGEAEKLLEELDSQLYGLKQYLESISPDLWTRESALEALKKTLDLRKNMTRIIIFPNKYYMVNGTVIFFGLKDFKIPIYVSTYPIAGYDALLTETSDKLLSTSTYGKETGKCSGKIGTTNFVDYYYLSGNYGKFNLLATEKLTSATGKLGDVVITNDAEEDLALAAIRDYKIDEKYIKKIVEDINERADKCQFIAHIAQGIAIAIKKQNPVNVVNAALFQADALVLGSVSLTLRRAARNFNEKAGKLIEGALQDTINRIQIVPEKAPVSEPENDSWKNMNTPPWSDYELLP